MKMTTWLRKNAIPVLIGLAFVVGLALSIEGVLCTSRWGGLLLNLGTEILGAVATYFLFAWFIARRQQKADLIAQMGSRVKDVAIAAAEELRRHGWLYDGSLRGVDLFGAELPGVLLAGANLQGANLAGANLQGAHLLRANLQGAFLIAANLQGASLAVANLEDAKYNEDTTLPDGTKWTPGTDMARFTDRNHPDFWEPPRPPKE